MPVAHREADERVLGRMLGGVIGMAWVPAGQASDGGTITISDRGKTYTATVTTAPFFDPEGEVLRG